MTKSQKKSNTNFFKGVISMTNEGGTYIYPAIGEVFNVVGGKLVGTEKGVKEVKSITVAKFHNKLQVK